MFGYIVFSPEIRRLRCEAVSLCGGRFLRLSVPARGALSERRLRKAAGLLRRQGVRRAVFPADYQEQWRWEALGIEPPDPSGLHRALLRRILLWALGGGSCAAAAICAGEMTRVVAESAFFLAGRCRYLYLDSGGDTAPLAAALRREYGLALIEDPGPGQVAACELVLLFSPGWEEARGRVLPFYKNAARPWSYGLGEELPEGADREQLLTALWEMGVICAKDVEIF